METKAWVQRQWTNTNWLWIHWGLQGLWSLMGRRYGRKALIWSLGKIVQHGGSGSRVMGLMSLQGPCGHVLLAGTWGWMGLGAMVNALHSLGLPNVSLPFCPLPGYLCALACLASVPRVWLAFPFDWQESGNVSVWWHCKWDETQPGLHCFTIFVGQPKPFWEAIKVTWWSTEIWPAMFQPFLCGGWVVSLHFHCSHTASSSANWKSQFRFFVHFF